MQIETACCKDNIVINQYVRNPMIIPPRHGPFIPQFKVQIINLLEESKVWSVMKWIIIISPGNNQARSPEFNITTFRYRNSKRSSLSYITWIAYVIDKHFRIGDNC